MPASADATAFDPAPRQVVCGRYELVSELGRGGMGTVWRARNVALDAPCALKFMLPELAQKDDLRQRFVREARAAAQLHSPHIVHVFDVGEWNGCPFMAMEFMEGESLEARLEREFKLPYPLALEIITQVANGLEAAHARGLVHRDLKPANIFLLKGERTTVKILDFGVAKHTAASSGVKTLHGALLGTPHYMSPEQARGEASLDRRADVWSLGIVAYECLTGRLPFNGESLPQLLGAILAGEIRPTGVPELEPFWQRASKRDPDQRYQSARELAEGLRNSLEGRSRLAPSTEVPLESGVRPSDAEPVVPMRRGLPVAAFIGAGVALIGIAAFALRGGDPTPAEPASEEASLVRPPPPDVPEPVPAPTNTPKAPSGFALDSQPSGALLIVDGVRSQRRTPVRLTELAPGRHAIALEKEGFLPWSQSVDVAQGKVVELPRAVLRPERAAAPAAANKSPSNAAAAPNPRTMPARAEPGARPNDRPPQRPERPRLGKYDDLIGF